MSDTHNVLPYEPALGPLERPEAPIAIQIGHATYSVQCPACREPLVTPDACAVKNCPACSIPHHALCLTEIGCSSLNCNTGGTRTHQALTVGDVSDNPIAEWIAVGNLHRLRYNEGDPEGGEPGTIYTGLCEGGESTWGERDAISAAGYAQLAAEFLGACCSEFHRPEGCRCSDEIRASYASCSYASTSGGEAYFEILATPCGCKDDDDNPWACEAAAVESLSAIEDYCLDDETWPWESAWQEEDWQNDAREEFGTAIAKSLRDHWEWSADVEIELPDALLDRFRWEAREGTEEYPECQGGGEFSWPLDVWAEWIIEDMPNHFDCLAYVVREDLRACYPQEIKLSAWETKEVLGRVLAAIGTAHGHGMLKDLTLRLLIGSLRADMGQGQRRSREYRPRRQMAYSIANRLLSEAKQA